MWTIMFFPVKANFKLIPLLIILRGFHKRNSLFLFSSFPGSFAPPFSLDFHLCLSVSLAILRMKILSNLTKHSLWNVQKEEYLQIRLLQIANCTEYTVYPLSHSFILSLIHYQAQLSPLLWNLLWSILPCSGGHTFLSAPETCLKPRDGLFLSLSLPQIVNCLP